MNGGYRIRIASSKCSGALASAEVVDVINVGNSRYLMIEMIPVPDVQVSTASNEGKKPRSFLEKWPSWYMGTTAGDGKTGGLLMNGSLERTPRDGTRIVRGSLNKDST